MNKIGWCALFALFIVAATFTALAPLAEETCCQKICAHKHSKLDFRKHYKSDYMCCKKESCRKVSK